MKVAKALKGLKPLLISLLLLQNSCEQSTADLTNMLTEEEKDSLVQHYLDNRPESYLIRMREWQLYMDSAINVQPNNAYLWQQKAMPYFKARKYSLGMKYLDQAVELDRSRYLSYQAFIKCIFIKDYESAMIDLEELLQAEPDGYVQDHTYQFYKGLCHLQLDEFDKARTSLTKSIQIQGSEFGEDWIHFLDYFYLGVANFELGKYQSAIADLDRSLQIYSQLSEALMYKAWSYYYLDELDTAKFYYYQANEYAEEGFTINEQNAIYEKYPYQQHCL